MKKCPQCRRTCTDESFDYCLDDGEVLVYGPGGEAKTEIPYGHYPNGSQVHAGW